MNRVSVIFISVVLLIGAAASAGTRWYSENQKTTRSKQVNPDAGISLVGAANTRLSVCCPDGSYPDGGVMSARFWDPDRKKFMSNPNQNLEFGTPESDSCRVFDDKQVGIQAGILLYEASGVLCQYPDGGSADDGGYILSTGIKASVQ